MLENFCCISREEQKIQMWLPPVLSILCDDTAAIARLPDEVHRIGAMDATASRFAIASPAFIDIGAALRYKGKQVATSTSLSNFLAGL